MISQVIIRKKPLIFKLNKVNSDNRLNDFIIM
jgi:hypothetical protein